MTTRWIDQSRELLTVAEMYRADAGAVARGITSLELMERAGQAVADALSQRWPEGRVVVLCGPGNNGGDGFVAARLLSERGRDVALALLGPRSALRGDAAVNAERWHGDVLSLEPGILKDADVVLDALFGAGLTRDLDGAARQIVDAVKDRRMPCLSVDVPSGVHGDTGQVCGSAPCADLTVTFFRRKPAHLLFPGRGLCGEIRIADIGIPDAVLDDIEPLQFANDPALWGEKYPVPTAQGHKYTRGHALVAGGQELTGAARLAAHAALRVGAGLASIASHPDALAAYRAGRPSIMVHGVADAAAFGTMAEDPRIRSILVGPGNGVSDATCAYTRAALETRAACVIDADAITGFAGSPGELFEGIRSRGAGTVLTPHEGEFARLFDSQGCGPETGRLARVRNAARLSGAVVVLKGPDTVIAAPDGRAAINNNAPPDLATAGSGDVLAGLILGLLAQGMDAFEAAAAAVWLHGEAANRFGAGLIAEDIADSLPPVLRSLRSLLGRD